MNTLRHLIIISISLFCISCDDSNEDLKSNNNLENHVTTIVNNELACQYLGDIDKNINSISFLPRKWMGGDDSCVLNIIDSLAFKFISTNEIIYLSALDSVCKYSDGYISEYLFHIYMEMFENDFASFIQYIGNQIDVNKIALCSIDMLAMGLYDKYYYGESSENSLRNVRRFLNKYRTKNLTLNENRVIGIILERVEYYSKL